MSSPACPVDFTLPRIVLYVSSSLIAVATWLSADVPGMLGEKR